MNGDRCVSIFLISICSICPVTISRFLSFFSFFPKASFYSFFGLNPTTVKRLGAATSDSLMVPAWTERQRPTLEVCLIRYSAECPTSIRNPFVGSDLFFRRILSKGLSHQGFVSSKLFACRKKVCVNFREGIDWVDSLNVKEWSVIFTCEL